MISDERLDKAMHYLAETDEAMAEAKTNVERRTWQCKRARAIAYEITTGAVDERKAAVERTDAVVSAEMGRIDAILECEKLKAKRETEALIVEVWRSLNANRRHGQ